MLMGNDAAERVKTPEALEMAEQLHQRVTEWKWRSDRAYALRLASAWLVNIALYLLFCLVAATYGVVKFRGAATNYMLATWGFAAVRRALNLSHCQPNLTESTACLPSFGSCKRT